MFQLWEKEWNEMINSFGLVVHGNISVGINASYKQEYQPAGEKYSIWVTNSAWFKEKTPEGFCQHAAEPSHLLLSVSLLGVAYMKL